LKAIFASIKSIAKLKAINNNRCKITANAIRNGFVFCSTFFGTHHYST
jgi:hypothetical protein